jgi:hypothetical protein
VFDTYLAGTMSEILQNGTNGAMNGNGKGELEAQEAAVVRLLRRQLETQASQ